MEKFLLFRNNLFLNMLKKWFTFDRNLKGTEEQTILESCMYFSNQIMAP